MPGSAADAFFYENLRPVSQFNPQTKLCIYEPTHKLYIVKNTELSCKPAYEAIRSLNNPRLAAIRYIAEKEDHIEIVRDFISGDTLADLLRGHRTLPRDTAVKIAENICDGLSALHRLGIVHRDINPNNIIVSSDGYAKIIDFGIARSFSEEKKTDTVILGTPGYAAPEQFGFSQSDARTDIYAVGVLLNVMLTGYLPNEKSVGGAIGTIIAKCIRMDSRRRYRDILELKTALYNKLPGDSPLDRSIRLIPGIRSQNPVIVVLAILCYLFVFLFSAAIFATAKKGTLFPTVISWIFCLPIPFFCFHNFLDVWDRLPFSAGASKRSQRITYTALGILSILVGSILFGSINAA